MKPLHLSWYFHLLIAGGNGAYHPEMCSGYYCTTPITFRAGYCKLPRSLKWTAMLKLLASMAWKNLGSPATTGTLGLSHTWKTHSRWEPVFICWPLLIMHQDRRAQAWKQNSVSPLSSIQAKQTEAYLGSLAPLARRVGRHAGSKTEWRGTIFVSSRPWWEPT